MCGHARSTADVAVQTEDVAAGQPVSLLRAPIVAAADAAATSGEQTAPTGRAPQPISLAASAADAAAAEPTPGGSSGRAPQPHLLAADLLDPRPEDRCCPRCSPLKCICFDSPDSPSTPSWETRRRGSPIPFSFPARDWEG